MFGVVACATAIVVADLSNATASPKPAGKVAGFAYLVPKPAYHG